MVVTFVTTATVICALNASADCGTEGSSFFMTLATIFVTVWVMAI